MEGSTMAHTSLEDQAVDYTKPFTVEFSFRDADGVKRYVEKLTHPLKSMVKRMAESESRAPWDSLTVLLFAVVLLCGRGFAQDMSCGPTWSGGYECKTRELGGGSYVCGSGGGLASCGYKPYKPNKKERKAQAERDATYDVNGFTREGKAKACEGIKSDYCAAPWVSKVEVR
jgi:hypothetical protein